MLLMISFWSLSCPLRSFSASRPGKYILPSSKVQPRCLANSTTAPSESRNKRFFALDIESDGDERWAQDAMSRGSVLTRIYHDNCQYMLIPVFRFRRGEAGACTYVRKECKLLPRNTFSLRLSPHLIIASLHQTPLQLNRIPYELVFFNLCIPSFNHH